MMKRSQINLILRDTEHFIKGHGFNLPPFAYWSAEMWREKRLDATDMISVGLGWDVTDFGSGDFEQSGLVLFTLRNGTPDNLIAGSGKTYAEKILVVKENQLTPLHFHWQKTEDIINRAGGVLAIQLYQSNEDESLSEEEVVVRVDGILRRLDAGGIIYLTPGESVTLPTRLYHAFWAADDPVLVGEVSRVNNDATDNRFFDDLGRFPQIVEDEEPFRLLVGDYQGWLG